MNHWALSSELAGHAKTMLGTTLNLSRPFNKTSPIFQVAAHLSGSPVVIQEVQTSWQTLALSVQGLPKYIQAQLGCLQVFLVQMYYLFSAPYQNCHHCKEHLRDRTEASAPHKNVTQPQSQATPASHHIRRPIRSPLIDKCNVKGCVGR